MSRIAAVLVTRDSQDYLPETLASIEEQTRKPELRIAIDDGSLDETRSLLKEAGFTVSNATSAAQDIHTRIAHNFLQGVRAAQTAGADIVVLGDHDDRWHNTRLEHQVGILEADPRIALVASDAFLIDEWGVAIPGTLRDTFPVPEDFADWSKRKQWSYALRHSLATGGASALRPDALDDWSVPSGWLHDRWWSLHALRHDALRIDPTPVIDYRLSADQQVGRDTGHQDDARRWIWGKARTGWTSATRTRQAARLIRG